MPSSLSADVFDALHELLRIFRARMRQGLESAGPELSFGELRVLMYVGRHPGCAQKALVEHSRADKAQMARTLARLQDKGWLTRSESADDRRVRHLRLSAQQEFNLAFSNLIAADHQHGPLFQFGKKGQVIHGATTLLQSAILRL